MQNKCSRIGIFGGTFDPIHIGHLIVAEDIRERFVLDRVLFIPSGNPPHKANYNVTPAVHRYSMVFLAVESNPFFEVSRIEMEREGYIYTVDTLAHLKELYGNKTEMFFIIGADIVWDLPKWKEPDKLFRMCEFIAALRPGCGRERLLMEIDRLRSQHQAKIIAADAPLIGISSTEIRERVKNGKSIKYFVPKGVEEYIFENGLYRSGGER